MRRSLAFVHQLTNLFDSCSQHLLPSLRCWTEASSAPLPTNLHVGSTREAWGLPPALARFQEKDACACRGSGPEVDEQILQHCRSTETFEARASQDPWLRNGKQ